jgi:hypothetical protein
MASDWATTREAMVTRLMFSWGWNEQEASDMIEAGFKNSFEDMLDYFLNWDAITEETYQRWYELAKELGK